MPLVVIVVGVPAAANAGHVPAYFGSAAAVGAPGGTGAEHDADATSAGSSWNAGDLPASAVPDDEPLVLDPPLDDEVAPLDAPEEDEPPLELDVSSAVVVAPVVEPPHATETARDTRA